MTTVLDTATHLVGPDHLRQLRDATRAAKDAITAMDAAVAQLDSLVESIDTATVVVATPCSWCGTIVGIPALVGDPDQIIPLRTLCDTCKRKVDETPGPAVRA